MHAVKAGGQIAAEGPHITGRAVEQGDPGRRGIAEESISSTAPTSRVKAAFAVHVSGFAYQTLLFQWGPPSWLAQLGP
ncbi:MAG: hypothetical protein M3463_03625 [Verrucomicrobiota bacterium]|nr:hypothetical protein [Verrucomicrobiota bacterium]